MRGKKSAWPTHLWMAIDTSTKYKLPLFVADTAEELAEHFGIKVSAVYQSASHAKSRKALNNKFVVIDMEGE